MRESVPGADRRRMGWRQRIPLGLSFFILSAAAAAAPTPPRRGLEEIRGRILHLEKDLVHSLKDQRQARSRLKKIRELMSLQQEEKRLSQARMQALERFISELESRKKSLNKKIASQKEKVSSHLRQIEKAARTPGTHEDEALEAPRRRVLARLVDRSLKDVAVYQADLADAEELENKIDEEKGQLAYLIQNIREQESLLEFHRQLQSDILKKRYEDRVGQLESYRRLKESERQVEDLIGQFNARLEFERVSEVERQVSSAILRGDFLKAKGKLDLPVAQGQIVSSFGRVLDPRSRLRVFKKGVDIQVGRSELVRAVFDGRVAYAGEIPGYGNVVILDHGEHYYTLCGKLGKIERKVGDLLAKGDTLGSADDQGSPIYFEIRARNVAVNPLQWLSASR